MSCDVKLLFRERNSINGHKVLDIVVSNPYINNHSTERERERKREKEKEKKRLNRSSTHVFFVDSKCSEPNVRGHQSSEWNETRASLEEYPI